MGTPTSVKYSRVPGTPDEALARLDERLLPICGLEYSAFAALRPDDDPYTEGLDLAQDLVPCHSRSEVLTLAHRWNEWAVSFLSREAKGTVDLYVFDKQKDSFGSVMQVETSMPYFETDEMPGGEWLIRLFLTTVSALECEVSGYGPDDAYETGYDSLDPSVVLARLRAGELFTIPSPQFHAISLGLVTLEEMAELLGRHPKGPFLKHRISTTGYHVLYAIGP